MSDEELLKMIENDDSGLLDIERKVAPVTSGDRLVDSFLEINNFFRDNNTEPISGKDINQHKLASRLKHIRDNVEQKSALVAHDEFNLLKEVKKNNEFETYSDIFEDDDIGLLESGSNDIFNIKNVPSVEDRKEADFVARRKPCEDFNSFEKGFIEIQEKIKNNQLVLKKFEHGDIKHNGFYVLDGILLFVDSIILDKEKDKSGKEDGRLRVIFENGTESGMRFRSLQKSLEINGLSVVGIDNKISTEAISSDDAETGYIYILKSLSNDPQILSVKNLYKIGFSTTSVEKRIENAKDDPTYLMAPVQIVSTFKCFNMNPQKLERLLHRFFANSCLNIDITDKNQNRYTPKEWFIAPIDVIEKSIHLMISGEIVNYSFDKDNMIIISKSS